MNLALWRLLLIWNILLASFALVQCETTESDDGVMGSMSTWVDFLRQTHRDRLNIMRPLSNSVDPCVTSILTNPTCTNLVNCFQYSSVSNMTQCQAQSVCVWDSKINVCFVNPTVANLYPICKAGGCASTISATSACQLSAASLITQYVCITDSQGNYCISQLDAALNAFSTFSSGVPTASALATICTPCVRMMFGALHHSSLNMYDLLCTQSNGHYCVANGYVSGLISQYEYSGLFLQLF